MNNPNNQYIFELNDLRATNPEITGGKGANLAILTRSGFKVPAARIVSVQVYREWIKQLPFNLHDVIKDTTNETALMSQCEELKIQLAAQPFPALIYQQLHSELDDFCSSGPVSVRSSATLEDLPGAAFAGQHDTYLGVSGIQSVIDNIKACFISLWDYRAVRYRLEYGFAAEEAGMAVVVQSMVAAGKAGVAFSVHPITGNTDHVLINSNFGLGETVVSGDGEIDQFTVDKTSQLLENHIGRKTHSLFLVGSATKEVKLSEDQANKASLTEEEAKRVADLARKAEQHFGCPQDIEWAIESGDLHLLQSRPITEMPARWTRQEAAERFPSPITPLTWEFTVGGFHKSLAYSLDQLGMPAFRGKWFERFDGYIYGNQTAVKRYTSGQTAGFSSLEEFVSLVMKIDPIIKTIQMLPATWNTNLDRYLLRIGQMKGEMKAGNLEKASIGQLFNRLQTLEQVGEDYFKPNIAISIAHGLLHKALHRLVELQCGDRAAEVYDSLTCFCETKTGQVNRELFDLYNLAKRDSTLVNLICKHDRKTIIQTGLLSAHPEFETAFQAFIADHGHREVEFDAYHPTWCGQPWVVLENLRLMLTSTNIPNPEIRDNELKSRQQHAEIKFLSSLPAHVVDPAAELIRLSRIYTVLDDVEHYHTTRLSVLFRSTVVSIGEHFRKLEWIDSDDDLFFISRENLQSLVENRLSQKEVQDIISTNKAAFKFQHLNEPPFELGQNKRSENDDAALQGLPGSPGSASGTTCVIRSVDDFSKFVPGSILVARTTNPAWTPLFYTASAVITESGGPLSHGAVTAREIGIPAVVAARNAMDLIGNGIDVHVDGTTGAIAMLDEKVA